MLRWNARTVAVCVAAVARGECSAIDLMKRKEAIVLREERATPSIPAPSPRSPRSRVVAFNGIQGSGKRREKGGDRDRSPEEEERTCKITRGVTRSTRTGLDTHNPPPAVARPRATRLVLSASRRLERRVNAARLGTSACTLAVLLNYETTRLQGMIRSVGEGDTQRRKYYAAPVRHNLCANVPENE